MTAAFTLGIIWATGSTFGFAFYQIANRRLVYDASIYRTTFLSLLISSLVGLAFIVFLEPLDSWSQLSIISTIYFALSGLFHFSFGWTLLGFSQSAQGAAQTSPLTSSSVIVSAILGSLIFNEPFNIVLIVGICLLIFGICLIALEQRSKHIDRKLSRFGIFTALLAGICWAISPVFFRLGYHLTPSVFIAILIGLITGSIGSFFLWVFNPSSQSKTKPVENNKYLSPKHFWCLQMLTGIIVGFAIFARWVSLIYLPIVEVNAVSMITIPTVVLIAPLVMANGLEFSGWKLWLGTIFMLIGVGMTLLGGI